MFTNSISLDNASRIWDVVVFEGDSILVRAAVAFFGSLESKLHGVSNDQEVLAVLGEGFGAEGMKEEDWIAAVRSAGKS